MQKARRHPPRRTPTACRRTVSGSLSPRCSRYFSPFPHGTCSLSVSTQYLALPDGAGGFSRDSSRPGLLRIPATRESLPLRDYHPLRRAFPGASGRNSREPRGSYYPGAALTAQVWAVPLPLAATHGITVVFSSSAYLDVSVRRVRLPIRTPADQTPLRVPADFRSLARPSSPRGAQASPVRPSLLASRPGPFCQPEAPDGTPCTRIAPQAGARRIFGYSTSMNLSRATARERETVRMERRNDAARPERRCSSRTFRYGYLVTT